MTTRRHSSASCSESVAAPASINPCRSHSSNHGALLGVLNTESRRRRRRIEFWSHPPTTYRDRTHAWAGMLIFDNGLMRLNYPNMHQITENAQRSGQPTPGRLHAFAGRGGRTVTSFRAGRGFGSLPLELATCRDVRLTVHNFALRSKDLPSREELRALMKLFSTIDCPVLFHCQSGADRAGMASALYLMLAEGKTVAEARQQLSPRYGHNCFSKTGILDAFLDVIERDTMNGLISLSE